MTTSAVWATALRDARIRASAYDVSGGAPGLPDSITVEVERVDAVEVRTQVLLVDADRPVGTRLNWMGYSRSDVISTIREFTHRQQQSHFPGKFWSATTQDWIDYESRNERDRLVLADFDPDVVDIISQPCTIFAKVPSAKGKSQRQQTPDLLVRDRSGALTFVNVTRPSRLEKEEVYFANGWLRTVCESAGFGFEVWVGARPQYMENVRFLSNFRNRPNADRSLLQQVVDLAGRSTVGDILSRCSVGAVDEGIVLEHLWIATWRGLVTVDLGHTVLLDTPVRRGSAA